MEQLAQVGDAKIPGEGIGAGGIPRQTMVRSVSHQDSLGRSAYPPEIQLDRQSLARSSDCLVDRQELLARAGSQDSLGGFRGGEGVSKHIGEGGIPKIFGDGGMPKIYGEGGLQFKQPGEGMTAAKESLANVRMPFPPIPKLDQFQAQFVGAGGPPPQFGGVSQGPQFGGGAPIHQYEMEGTHGAQYGGGHHPISSHFQFQQSQHYQEMTPSYGGGDNHQDQGWRLPQYKRRDVNPSTYHTNNMVNTQTNWTRPDQEKWRQMGAPLAQSMGPPLNHPGYPGGLGPMGGMGMVGWQERDRYGRDDCGSGLSRESSRDDINSECEQQFEYEQRFRVDRRKLEMMMTNSPEFGEAAAEFFERIGAETDTCVIWPSRLKIGAKSKKDPHIRVGGQEEGVKRAKLLITEVLDTTTNRYILRLFSFGIVSIIKTFLVRNFS